jgi:hypothetical protein
MLKNPDVFDQPVDYKINLKLEKYHTQKAMDAGVPDEVLNIPGNCLTNKGINIIWKALTDTPRITDGTDGRYEMLFNNANSYIGVGTADNNPPSSTSALQPLATDEKLYAEDNYIPATGGHSPSISEPHYLYMKMNSTYPLAGDNQKVVFQSTFLPGVAVFNWYEWCIANGCGNPTYTELEADPYIIRFTEWGIADGNDIDDVAPDPVPTRGTSYQEASASDKDKKTLLNHRFESMGRKYASATWIITVEVSLS